MKALATTSIAGTRQMPGLLSPVAKLAALVTCKQSMALTKQNGQRTLNGYNAYSLLSAGSACPTLAINRHAFRPETASFIGSDWNHANIIRGGNP